ncbi:hypothetical protein ACFC26_07745 [Kitasatospora purpeofusca]|uniref:hypothetical protein n=1 Tax=Kitasatospora purpeofusca TaxID=67352 RepID=UPI0035DC3782
MGLQLPEGCSIRRTRVSRQQAAFGAWLWRVHGPDGLPFVAIGDLVEAIGSYVTLAELLRAPLLAVYREERSQDIVVDVLDEGRQHGVLVSDPLS